MKAITCQCGQQPEVVKENDGYWYVLCSQNCGAMSSWSKSESRAISLWNTQAEAAKKPEAAR